MRSWKRFLVGGLLLAAVAVAGIALNFTLLGLTQYENDPVGKLSPRAVFPTGPTTSAPTTTAPTTTAPVTSTSGNDDDSPGSDGTPGSGDGDGDDDGDDD